MGAAGIEPASPRERCYRPPRPTNSRPHSQILQSRVDPYLGVSGRRLRCSTRPTYVSGNLHRPETASHGPGTPSCDLELPPHSNPGQIYEPRAQYTNHQQAVSVHINRLAPAAPRVSNPGLRLSYPQPVLNRSYRLERTACYHYTMRTDRPLRGGVVAGQSCELRDSCHVRSGTASMIGGGRFQHGRVRCTSCLSPYKGPGGDYH